MKNLLRSIFYNRILKHFSIYTAANFLNQAISLMLLPILTRYLSPSDYGVWATFSAIVGVGNILVAAETTSAVVRAYFDKDKGEFDFPQYNYNALLLNLVFFAVIITAICLALPMIRESSCIPVGWIFAVPVIGICTALYNIPTRLFVYRKKPVAYSSMKIADTSLEIVLSLVFVVVMGMGWQGRASGLLWNNLLLLPVALYLLIRGGMLRFSVNFSYMKNILSYSLPVVILNLGFTAGLAIDRFFLNRFVGLSATGIYSVAYSVSSIVLFFVNAFSLAWTPFLFERLNRIDHAMKIKLVRFAYMFFAAIMAVSLLIPVMAPLLLKIFVGKDYYGAAKYMLLLSMSWGFYGMYFIVSGYIFYEKKTYALSVISIFVLLLNALLDYALISANGALGAAQAGFICSFARFAVTWFWCNKIYPMPWFSCGRRACA